MRSVAIVLAAGKGRRMGNIRKQYMLIKGKEVLFYSLWAFMKSKVDDIIIVCGEEDIDYVKKEIVEKYGVSKVKSVVAGGAERYYSVHEGLKEAKSLGYDEGDIALIHDGARPFILSTEINALIDETLLCKACIAANKAKDTVKMADDEGNVAQTPERDRVWMVQTPQCFDFALIKEAYDNVIQRAVRGEFIQITDDAMVLEYFAPAFKIKLVECSYNNIKITTPEDVVYAESIIENRVKEGI